MVAEATALNMLRMPVNRPGAVNGLEWQDWKHPSWKELDRLDSRDNFGSTVGDSERRGRG